MKIRNFLGLAVLVVPHYSYADIELDEFNTPDTYISPTRLKQSPHDIPASVTKITRKTINDLQLNDIPEVFRYVAGMISGHASGNQPRINYHGTNGLIPRRMQVLLDGISVYRPGYAEVVWATLPISVNDIESIEITRSPSAAVYGSNSMVSVINITTKDPVSVGTLEVDSTTGSRGTRNNTIQAGGDIGGSGRYRVSLSSKENDGFDKNFLGEERHDGTESRLINGRVIYQLTSDTVFQAFAGYSDADTDLEYRHVAQTSFPDISTESYYATAALLHSLDKDNEIKVRLNYSREAQEQEFGVCYPLISFSYSLRALELQNPEYSASLANNEIPAGGSASDDALRNAFLTEAFNLGGDALSPWCGTVNENAKEGRYGVEVEYTSIVNEDLRFVTGAAASRSWVDSRTFLNGNANLDQYNLFGNAEIRLDNFLINVGGMFEHEPKYLENAVFSPRIGLNYKIMPQTTIRGVLSKGKRTPGILEHERDWSYIVYGSPVPHPEDGSTARYVYFRSKSTESLASEEVLAREISLFHSSSVPYKSGSINRLVDVKYFYNSLTNLVSEKPGFVNYIPTNNGKVTLQGFETSADLAIKNVLFPETINAIRLHVNYAYIDNKTDEFYETSLHARHSGAAYFIVDFKNDWTGSLSYYGNSSISGEAFDGFEAGLGKRTKVLGGELDLKGKLVYYPDKVDSFTVSETFSVQNINDDSLSVFVSISFKLP